MSEQADLTTGPIARTLLVFALPTLGSNILQSLNGSVNAIWVGNLLGEAALAATANANNIMFLMFSAVFGLAMATTILVGQAIGAGNVDLARRTVGSSIGLVTALGVVSAVIGWLETPRLLALLETPTAAVPLATDYLRMIFAGLPFTFLTVLLSASLRGSGDAVTPLRAMILSVVLDIALNPLLIRGFGPVPPLGITGSALATLIAGLVTSVFLVVYIYARDLPLRLRGREFAYLRPDRALLAAIFSKGLPIGLSMVVLSLSILTMMGLINQAGVHTTAAFGAISQLWGYVQMPAMAIGAGVSAMAAQNIGAGRWDRIDRIAWAGCWMNVFLTSATVVIITVFERPLLGLFLTPDSEAVPIAIHINHLVSWSMILFGLSIVLTSVMRANGAVFAPLAILFLAFFPVRIGVALGFRPTYGIDAVWWSFPVGSFAALLLTLLAYRYSDWRNARLLAPQPAPA